MTKEEIEHEIAMWERNAESSGIVEGAHLLEVYRLALRGLEAQWRAMETSPKDGTDLLVAFPWGSGLLIEVAYYCPRDRRWSTRIAPTHWQPLPAAPEVG